MLLALHQALGFAAIFAMLPVYLPLCAVVAVGRKLLR